MEQSLGLNNKVILMGIIYTLRSSYALQRAKLPKLSTRPLAVLLISANQSPWHRASLTRSDEGLMNDYKENYRNN